MYFGQLTYPVTPEECCLATLASPTWRGGSFPHRSDQRYRVQTMPVKTRHFLNDIIKMNTNIAAAVASSKKKVPSKPRGKHALKPSVQHSSSATDKLKSSLGEPPADMSITKYVCRCSYGLLETFSLFTKQLWCVYAGFWQRMSFMKG